MADSPPPSKRLFIPDLVDETHIYQIVILAWSKILPDSLINFVSKFVFIVILLF